jgi:LemA protein
MKNKKGQMGGAIIALIVILVIIVFLILMIVGMYNGFVNKDVSVQNQWGKVQSAYQRRLDLIPNLVSTVKGSADFEKTTQTQIASLRSQVNNAKNPDDMKSVDTGTSNLIRDINIQVEAYPDLKSTENFRALQDELAGTENRIKWERDEYNNQVRNYQTATRTFPGNVFAGMFGFLSDKYKFFESTPGAENPPVVNFTG